MRIYFPISQFSHQYFKEIDSHWPPHKRVSRLKASTIISLFVILNLISLGASGNIIQNGDFSLGFSSWSLYEFPSQGVVGTTSVSGGVCSVYNISTASTPEAWQLQLMQIFTTEQRNMLALDSSYILTFDASADSDRPCLLSLVMNEDPWSAYITEDITITTQTQSYSFNFTADALFPSLKLAFNLGESSTPVYISNVSLVKKENVSSGQVYDSIVVPMTYPYLSDLDFADFNNDGLQDLIIVSNYQDYLGHGVTIHYYNTSLLLNDNNQGFIDSNAGLEGVQGRVKASDMDNDGDIDIIISGENDFGAFSGIYEQDYSGDFELREPPFKSFVANDITIGDFNNDGLKDLILMNNSETKIYLNRGDLEFIEYTNLINPSFTGIHGRSNIFDISQDGKNELLFNGYYISGNPFSKYYSFQNGAILSGELSEFNLEGTGPLYDINNDGIPEFIGDRTLWYPYPAFGDINNDGLLDCISQDTLYTYLPNDLIVKEPFHKPDIKAVYDIDLDGDLDLISSSYGSITVYLKQSNSNEKPSVPTGLESVVNGRDVELKWNKSFDSQTDSSQLTYNVEISYGVLSPEATTYNNQRKTSKLGNAGYSNTIQISDLEPKTYYWTVQSIDNSFYGSDFALKEEFTILGDFVGVDKDTMGAQVYIIADFNNDRDIDFICTSTVYENNRDGTFDNYNSGIHYYKDYGAKFYTEFGDINNDNTIDIIIDDTLYLNKGDLSFDPHIYFPHPGYSQLSDMDNDGWVDILFQDTTGTADHLLIIYNDSGLFKDTLKLEVTQNSDFQVCDIDGDQDMDIITPFMIYENQNDRTFTPAIALETSFNSGYVEIVDIDTDDDFDIVIFDSDNTILYRNDVTGFEPVPEITIPNFCCASYGSFTRPHWGDYDHDGDPDLAINNSIPYVYENRTNSVFNELVSFNAGETGLGGESSWIDYDNDGDLDLIYYYHSIMNHIGRSNLSENTNDIPNDASAVPTNLQARMDGFELILSWEDTINRNMSYNIWVGTSPTSCNIVSPMSDLETGFRKVYRPGNMGYNKSWKLDLPLGKYYWSVQTIDQSYTGGAWAPVESYTINRVSPDFTFDTICRGIPTSFIDRSVSSENLTRWSWEFGDGNTSSSKNASHLYAEAGTFNVTHWAWSESGDSASISKDIIVRQSPGAEFNAPAVCDREYVEFSDHSALYNLGVTSYQWDFGDGTSSTVQESVTHLYSEPGQYDASLTINADNGCSELFEQTVIVAKYPDATISLFPGYTNVICDNDSSILVAKAQTNCIFQWKLNDINLLGEMDTFLIIKENAGEYSVEIENTLASCFSEDNISVSILTAPPVPQLEDIPKNLCPSDRIVLTINNYNSGYEYQWLRNGTFVDDAVYDTLHRYLREGDYTVVIYNEECKSESEIKTLNFKSDLEKPELVVFGPNVWYIGCRNDSATNYHWYYNGKLIENETDFICMANQNLGDYQVEIFDATGCSYRSDIVTIPADDYKRGNIALLPSHIDIYPNPTKNGFTLDLQNSFSGELKITITDISGQIVENVNYIKTEDSFSQFINTQSWSPGIYHINITLGSIHLSRILIQH